MSSRRASSSRGTSSASARATAFLPTRVCFTRTGSRSTSRSSPASRRPSRRDRLRSSPGAPLAERTSMVYAGTGATRGSATAVVVATGAQTEQGAIAELVDEAEPTSDAAAGCGSAGSRAGWWCSGVGVTVVLGAAMLARGESAREAFLVGVSVAVAAVPEGLAATVTIALALGSREMARRGAIVRTLSAIETIGEATVDLHGQDRDADREPAAARASRAGGGPWVGRAVVGRRRRVCGRSRSRRSRAPCSLRRAGTGRRDRDAALAALRGIAEARHSRRTSRRAQPSPSSKGAPEVVLARCVARPGRARAAGLRRRAVGGRRDARARSRRRRASIRAETSEEELESSLQPLGLVGLTDPLRPTAASSLRRRA